MTTLETLQQILETHSQLTELDKQRLNLSRSLDGLFNALYSQHQKGAISFPFVYRGHLFSVDSVGTITVKQVAILEDQEPTKSNANKRYLIFIDPSDGYMRLFDTVKKVKTRWFWDEKYSEDLWLKSASDYQSSLQTAFEQYHLKASSNTLEDFKTYFPTKP